MHKHRSRTIAAVLVTACAVFGLVAATARSTAHGAPIAGPSCQLQNGAGAVKHVIYLQFDNTHYKRDRPDVPSDLEQMPHLKNFLESNGTVFTNDHTILISHTAGGILSSLTGLYPDRNGQTVSNSYGYFKPDGTVRVLQLVQVLDRPGRRRARPAAEHDHGRPEDDAGAVGAVHAQRLRRRRRRHREHRAREHEHRPDGRHDARLRCRLAGVERGEREPAAGADRLRRDRDPLLALATSRCTGDANAKPDPLPDEPGGYDGFNALYGAKYVNPAITASTGASTTRPAMPIADPKGNCGFPGFDGMLATNTLGYVAQMQENGVPGHLRLHLGRARHPRRRTRSGLVLEPAPGPGSSSTSSS